jgi:hypothetical protein
LLDALHSYAAFTERFLKMIRSLSRDFIKNEVSYCNKGKIIRGVLVAIVAITKDNFR